MRRSTDRIITTHAGSLSRPGNLIAMNRARAAGERRDDALTRNVSPPPLPTWFANSGRPASTSRRRRVRQADGRELRLWRLVELRLCAHGRVCPGGVGAGIPPRKSSVANLALTTIRNRRDGRNSSEFYQDPESSGSLVGSAARGRASSGLHGADQIHRSRRDPGRHRKSKNGNGCGGYRRRLMCSIGSGSFARGEDLYYKNGRNSSLLPPKQCARNIRRSSTPALCSRSTIRACRTTGT